MLAESNIPEDDGNNNNMGAGQLGNGGMSIQQGTVKIGSNQATGVSLEKKGCC
jgi:hypothetical protein